MIKLSNEQIAIVNEGLKKSGCPFCKNKGQFKIAPEVFTIQAHVDVDNLSVEELAKYKVGSIEAVATECGHCGYLMLFNYRTLFGK